jgi:hypothetical protein
MTSLSAWAVTERIDQYTGPIKSGTTLSVVTESGLVAAQSDGTVSGVTLTASITLTANRVMTKPLNVAPGAVITLGAFTLTLPSFSASYTQCFSGSGVILSAGSCNMAMAVWWGSSGAALQQAITAGATAGVPIWIGDRGTTWGLTAGLTLPSHTHLYGDGAVINSVAVTTAAEAKGSLGGNIGLTVNADAATYSVTVSNSAGFVVDEWVLVCSSDKYPYTANYEVDRGEFKRIRAVAGNIIYFATPLEDAYTVGLGATVYHVNWVTDIRISGITFQGVDTEAGDNYGVRLTLVRDSKVDRCQFLGYEYYALSYEQSLEGEAWSNYVDGVQYEGAGGALFYAFVVVDASQNINIHDNIVTKNRHLGVTSAHSSGQGYYGQPLNCVFDHNIAYDMQAGTDGTSYAFEHHGFGKYIRFHGNVVNGACCGAHVDEGGWVDITDNIFTNLSVGGITLADGAATVLNDVKIHGNYISTEVGHGAYHGYGIRYLGPVGCVLTDIDIADNTIVNFNSSGNHGIGFTTNTANRRGLIIRNNSIFSGVLGAQDADSGYGIALINNGGWIVSGNYLSGSRSGIYSNTDTALAHRNVIINNVIEYDNTATAGWSIYVKGDRNLVKGNVIKHGWVGIGVIAGGIDNLVTDNVNIGTVTPIQDGGTTTILRNNDTL